MSPKTFKNKKESTDSKRADSKIESGSAPFSKLIDEDILPGLRDNDSVCKPDPDLSSDELDNLAVPPLRQDSSEDEHEGRNKATVYFDTFTKAIIKVIASDKQVMVFPMLVKNFIDKQGYFSSLRTISNCICDMIDSELDRQGYYPFFTGSFKYENGFASDMRIESHDKSLGDDFYLHDKNYEDMFFASYMEQKKLTIHVHVNEDILKPIDKMNDIVKPESSQMPAYDYQVPPVFTKDELVQLYGTNPVTFRGHPIDMKAKAVTQMPFPSTPIVRPDRSRIQDHQKRNATSGQKPQSPISVYDDADYLVKNPVDVCPFGQQSTIQRVNDLQTAAATNIPEVTTLPKLLKSHNVGYKEGDNAATWYSRFNDFCLMIGIYLPPPNAMKKDSEMGKEWDSNVLPFVFYSRVAKMEKVLTHILHAPDFFPKSMSDELQLNPKPYNFLRLFMALRSSSVPELSDRIIKRPGPMKHSQTLAQYALAWVNYFTDENNVNGIRYSKFRQYCYFVDGISSRYSTIKKFLEMEFTTLHDRDDNIPISLELRNIPTTIMSLCHTHGINSSPTHVQKVVEFDVPSKDDCCSPDPQSHVKKIQQSPHKSKGYIIDKPTVKNDNSLQCWLCDGAHSFRQCKELVRMKTICAQRPQVRKHFRQLLLDRNAPALKVLTEAPDIFEDEDQDDHETTPHHTEDIEAAQVNSVDCLPKDTFTLFDDGQYLRDVTTFPTNESNQQIKVEEEPQQDFFVLAIDDNSHAHSTGILESFQCDCSLLHHASPSHVFSARNMDFVISEFSSLHVNDTPHEQASSIQSVSFQSNQSQVKYHQFTTQVDGGADRCTTPHRDLDNNMRPPNPSLVGEPMFVLDAGKHKHPVEGIGEFRAKTWID